MSVYDGFTCTEIWTVSCGLWLGDDVLFQTDPNIFHLDVGVTTTFCAWPQITLATATNADITPVFRIFLKLAY